MTIIHERNSIFFTAATVINHISVISAYFVGTSNFTAGAVIYNISLNRVYLGRVIRILTNRAEGVIQEQCYTRL